MGFSVVGSRLDGSMQNSFGADCDSDRLQTGWPQRFKGWNRLVTNTCVRRFAQGNLKSYASRRKSQSILATCFVTSSSCEWIFGISKLIGSDGTEVASLDSPTAEPVQTMIVSKDTRTKLVTIKMYVAHRLAFREVEIYNGPLLGKDIQIKAILTTDVKSFTLNWAPFDAELFME